MAKITKQQHDEIIEKYQTGNYSTVELGKKYGVSSTAIIKHLRKDGLPGRATWAQTENKRCNKCGRVLPMSDFYRRADYICKDCMNKLAKEHPNYNARYRKYNLTEQTYQELLKKQGYKCAICGQKMNGKRFAVDHDHKTGKVRGLLCENCNRGLGLFQDNIAYLANAIKYLKENS